MTLLGGTRTWARRGMVFAPPEGHSRWASHAQAPTVLALGPRLWRVYVGGRDSANRSHLYGIDLDPGDGLRILRVDDRPLLDCGAPGSFDADGMGPAAVLRVDGQVRLYYSGMVLRRDVPYQVAVGLAVSDDDGLTFRRATAGPVLAPGSADPIFTSTPWVWREAGCWRALYSSALDWTQVDGRWECRYELRQAGSADGLHWQRDARPALALQEGEAGLVRPCVVDTPSGRELWFSRRGVAGFRGPGDAAYRLHCAHWDAARGWVRDGAARWSPLAADDDWDSWMQAYACIVARGDDWVMLYNGNDFGRAGFGWASTPRHADDAV